MLRWMKARVDELSPFVTNQAPTRDLQYYLQNAFEKWEAAGDIPLPEAMPVEAAPEPDSKTDEPCHKRGPKTDSFLNNAADKDRFVEKLRGMILKRFRLSRKSGIMEVRRENLQELEPSKYFACLFAALIAYGVAKSNATPKGFDRLIKEAIAGTELQETFRLHYTSYNILYQDGDNGAWKGYKDSDYTAEDYNYMEEERKCLGEISKVQEHLKMLRAIMRITKTYVYKLEELIKDEVR